MSEKIYTWLLRLYPSHFREAYGDEALQLFRDRSRYERGFFPGLRLWLDLLADLALSVPRQHRCVPPSLIGASARPYTGGLPSFHVLEGESLRLSALLFGGALSLVAFGACSILFSYAGKYRPTNFSSAQSQGRSQHSWLADPIRAIVPSADHNGKVDAVEQQRVIQAVIANLKEHYIDPAVAQNVADALLEHEKRGDYDATLDGAAFAALLTRQLRDVSHDVHLEVVYSQAPLPNRPPGPTAEGLERYRKAMAQNNCTFEKVEILPHNIGYLKLNSFPEPSMCRPTATAAMASLNRVNAIIFDLRDNRGGYPGMVMLLAAYLFDHPEYMYNPRENTTQRSWTNSPVPGNRLADKPVYVLTSARTFSGAEHFSYNLKMLKRATLVGERTGGATDVGIFHPIDDHFGMGIRETRAINPYSEPDWAVRGVEPDVKVKAADALEKAEQLARFRE